jgi:hypothetical protein
MERLREDFASLFATGRAWIKATLTAKIGIRNRWTRVDHRAQ